MSGDSVGAFIGGTPPGNPTQWLIDGTILAFPDFPSDIVALNADAPGPATELLRADWDERAGRVSPDEKWLAYLSNEAARFQLTVRAWQALDRRR